MAHDTPMGFLEHLDELRARLIRACIAVGAGMALSFLFVDRIADFVLRPIVRSLPPGSTLMFVKPGEAFSFYLDLALIGGAVLAAPYLMFQVWRFIAPALYANEKRFVVPFVCMTIGGTLAGALFSHYVMFPSMMTFFGTFHPSKVEFMPTIEYTFDLYKSTLLGMVVVFQMPTLIFFLTKMRIVTARLLIRHVKYAVLAIFILAAVLTPSTDVGNMAAMAAPMLALYLLSIGLSWVVAPRSASSSGSAALGIALAIACLSSATSESAD